MTTSTSRNWRWGSWLVAALLGLTFGSRATVARASTDDYSLAPQTTATSSPATSDLTSMSLEDLMNLEVTSVSKQRQRLSDAPAAVYVITSEDIRHSGMNSIPELLRMAPGLDVAQVTSNSWAIGARGFGDVDSNKLLVLVDGRSVYQTLFSGVYWDTVDYVLADLDRIEVIRGPGATLWGANAVNGVINITTKDARDTQGWLLSGYGSNVDGQGALRYGGQIDDRTYYRVYTKYRTDQDFPMAGGSDSHDGWDQLRGGFRIDRYATDQDTFTLEGDLMGARNGQELLFPILTAPYQQRVFNTYGQDAGDLLGRWTHVISPKSDFSVQIYYDHLRRDDAQVGYTADTLDGQFQHRFPIGQRQELIWGVGGRGVRSEVESTPVLTTSRQIQVDYLLNAFVQDDLTIVPDRLHLIAGSKFEQNNYTGFEIQPAVRAVWTPDERNSLWASVSRAVRTPARAEDDARLSFGAAPGPGGLPIAMAAFGNTQYASEELTAYELGYRVRPARSVALDVAGFFNDYDNLRSISPGTPVFQATPIPHLLMPLTARNDLYGETYGLEFSATWNVSESCRLVGSYSFMTGAMHVKAGATDLGGELTGEGSFPHNQFQIRSYWDITRHLELNGAVYYVDNAPAFATPAYVRVDLALTWRPVDAMELSIGVQNLLDDQHPEFGQSYNSIGSEIPRTYYGQVTWRF